MPSGNQEVSIVHSNESLSVQWNQVEIPEEIVESINAAHPRNIFSFI